MSTRVLVGLFGEASPSEDLIPAPVSAPTAARPARRSASLVRIAGVVVLVFGILATGTWVWRSKPSLLSVFRRTLMDSPGATQPEATAEVPQAATQAQVARHGTPTGAPRVVRVVPAGGSPREVATPEAPLPAADLVAAPSPVTGEPAVSNEVAPPAVAESVTLPVEPAREVSPAVPSRVYGAADLDVTPPESIGRQKLGGLVGAIQPGAVVTIEFIVNETGTVESAKATTSPRTLGESLLLATGLHAVKSWQFRPARRNGQAVSYRKSLSFGAY